MDHYTEVSQLVTTINVERSLTSYDFEIIYEWVVAKQVLEKENQNAMYCKRVHGLI